MTRILPTALVIGVIVGLLVAAYMNVFNVPVMEWAIALEGCDIDRAGCAEQLAAAEEEAPLPLSFLTSLGGQRVGMSVGLAVIGILYAAIFTGLYHLMRTLRRAGTRGHGPRSPDCSGSGAFPCTRKSSSAQSSRNRRRRDVVGAAGIPIPVHRRIDDIRCVGDIRRRLDQSQFCRFGPLDSLRRDWTGLRGGSPVAGIRHPQRPRCRAGVVAAGTHHNVPHLHRLRTFPALDGHRLRHRRLSPVPRTRRSCLSAVRRVRCLKSKIPFILSSIDVKQ